MRQGGPIGVLSRLGAELAFLHPGQTETALSAFGVGRVLKNALAVESSQNPKNDLVLSTICQ
jgi:hypothetical protein